MTEHTTIVTSLGSKIDFTVAVSFVLCCKLKRAVPVC
jgi:hypothetical protein